MVVAGCGGSDSGAILTVRAPEGPVTASRVEIVLANPLAIEDVQHQRTAPTDVAEGVARYYRQLATAGSVDAIESLDGFVVQIAPNIVASSDTKFVPFLIALDAADRVAGIGAVLNGDGDPSTVEIAEGKLIEYDVVMTALVEVDGERALAAGEALVVACPTLDQAVFQSGIAWEPGGSAQLRLLQPDPATADDDASARELDLDCDAAIADVDDCDDLRGEFHAGAAEACDGRDTDCDFQRLEMIRCPLAPTTCGNTGDEGVAVCVDRGDSPGEGTCTPPPACQCAAGGPPPCTKCVLEFLEVDPDKQSPCAPAIDTIGFPNDCNQQTPCTIEVVRDPNSPWEALISTDPDGGGFSPKVTGVVDKINLLVKLNAGEVMGTAGSSVGEVFVLLDNGMSTTQVGIDLQLTIAGASELSCPISNGRSPMACD